MANIELVPRGSGRLGPSRYDIVLLIPYKGLKIGESLGQIYLNDEGKRQPSAAREALARYMEIMVNAGTPE